MHFWSCTLYTSTSLTRFILRCVSSFIVGTNIYALYRFHVGKWVFVFQDMASVQNIHKETATSGMYIYSVSTKTPLSYLLSRPWGTFLRPTQHKPRSRHCLVLFNFPQMPMTSTRNTFALCWVLNKNVNSSKIVVSHAHSSLTDES